MTAPSGILSSRAGYGQSSLRRTEYIHAVHILYQVAIPFEMPLQACARDHQVRLFPHNDGGGPNLY